MLGLKGVKEIIFARVDERREDDPENLANDLKQKRHAIHHSAMVGPWTPMIELAPLLFKKNVATCLMPWSGEWMWI